MVKSLAKVKSIFICENCGYESPKWLGKCPDCNNWNTFEESLVEKKSSVAAVAKKVSLTMKPVKKLSDITSSKSDRITTGINEFDRVMGGGIVKDSITIITARPGAGKSTLLLQVAHSIAHKGHKVIYASGEESDSQIKNRADRILNNISDNIWVLQETSMDNVVHATRDIDPDLIIIIVGQMTKADELAGLRALEHLVDTVLIIEANSDEELRGLISSKNRFGSTGETGFFQMTEKGMESIDNPSEYFMTKREDGDLVSGSTLTVVKEGSRAIIMEVEN